MSRHSRLRHFTSRAERSALLALKFACQSVKQVMDPPDRAKVGFVAGVQRSGTNMLIDVLEQSFATDVYHEWDSRAFDNYQMRDSDVIGALWRRSKAPHFVIKSLCELQRLAQLMAAFAPAKIVWIVRDYNDVVNSMQVSFSNQAQQVQRIAQDRESDGWQGNGMSDETHELVKGVVHPGISDASAAALIWYFRNQLYFDQGLAQDPRVLLVRYESLVTNPDAEFARVFEFLDIPYRPWHSRKVVKKYIGKAAAPEIDEPIRLHCEAMMRRFDALCPSVEGTG